MSLKILSSSQKSFFSFVDVWQRNLSFIAQICILVVISEANERIALLRLAVYRDVFTIKNHKQSLDRTSVLLQ